jgi:hypothetical protein
MKPLAFLLVCVALTAVGASQPMVTAPEKPAPPPPCPPGNVEGLFDGMCQ